MLWYSKMEYFFNLQQAHSHSQAAVYELAAQIIQTESDSFDLFM